MISGNKILRIQLLKFLWLSVFMMLCLNFNGAFAQDHQGLLVDLNGHELLSRHDGSTSSQKLMRIIHLDEGQKALREVLQDIADQGKLKLSFSEQLIPLDKRIKVEEAKVTVKQALWSVLKGTSLRFGVSATGQLFFFEMQEDNSIARQETIIGTVTDAGTGETLPGVNIAVKGTTTGTSTNSEGRYELIVPSLSDTLLFSFIGYQTQEIPIDGRTTIDVALQMQAVLGEELVVVGYGTRQKETLTGAISSVESEAINVSTNSSLAQKLQGKVAGLNIRQNSGQPGQFDNNIQIRGFGDPMYVIDGIIRNDPGAFQRLNPNDIESVSVLKDASAAVYGIGAANGVVIVTTKQGSIGEPTFTYSMVTGISSPTNRVKQATAAEYVTMLNESGLYSDPGRISAPTFPKEEFQKWQEGTQPGYTGTDWWDLTMKEYSSQSQHNLSVSGGSEKVTYYIGLEYMSDNGILRSGDIGYDRANLRTNVTADISNSLRARVNIGGMYDKAYSPGESFHQISRNTIVTLPTEYPYANGNSLYPATTTLGITPLAASDRDLTGYNEDERRNLQSSFELRYTVPFVENLTLTGTGSYDINNLLNKNLRKGFYTYTYDEIAGDYNETFQRPDQNIFNLSDVGNTYMLQAKAEYEAAIGLNHEVEAMLVAEQYKGWNRLTQGRRYYGDFYTNDQFRFASETNQEVYGYEEENARISYIGRLNYTYDQKYLFEFAFNYNGSFRYHPDNRFGFFPVVSGAWRLSEERFIENNFPSITELKIRGSYGVIGTDVNIADPFQHIQGFSFSQDSFWEFEDGAELNGLESPAIVNRTMTWATNHTADIGFDLSLWEGLLDVTFDIYNRERKGLVATRATSLPNTFGASLPQENLNSDRQTGFDLVLGHRNQINEFTYNISANMNWARTMVRHQERSPFQSQRDRWLNGQQDRWTSFIRGYLIDDQFTSFEEINNAPLQEFSSIRELPGDYQFKDVNNDGIIDGEDALQPYKFGTTPLFNYGLMINLGWKGFDATMLFQGASHYTVRYTQTLAEWFWFSGSLPAYFMDRWHQADPYDSNSEWITGQWPAPRPNATQTMQKSVESGLWRRNASYIRLKNIDIGYTFSPEKLQSLGIQRLRVYVNAFNILTWTKDPLAKRLDPEKTAGPGEETTGHNYPLTKNYNVGLNITF